MRKTAGLVVVAVLCMALCAPAFAQEASRPKKLGAPAEMQPIAALAGTWEVDFEARQGPDEPFMNYQTTSKIEPILDGAFVQEVISQPMRKGPPIRLIGIWGYDRYRKVYRFAWLDDTFAMFDVHEGQWRNGALVVNNLLAATALPIEGQEIYGQMTWSDFKENEFSVDSSVSTDCGATWWTQARGRYRRSR